MADHIQVTLPDGSKKEVSRGTTPLDVARGISPRLAEAALVAKIKQSAVSNQQSAVSTQHSAPDHSGGSGQHAGAAANAGTGDKTPASMHAQ
ncbi:MAG TPA: TGS domain-containing protein, partial [Ktedonobacterales bacterium]|nr:TGS domain-containing protein [Ktedonobacterales bacterium]